MSLAHSSGDAHVEKRGSTVWLANGGRERLTTRGLLLTNYSEMHGISLENVVSCSASTFKLIRKAKPQKRGKNGCNLN